MTAVVEATTVDAAVARLVAWLERGETDGLFAPDTFADLTFPHWRLQVQGAEAMDRLKNEMHPPAGQTRLEDVRPTRTGYVARLEERWEREGQQWYCREAFICDLDDEGRITELAYYCTGDWDEAKVAEHAQAVTLIRP
ncbi:hypothetical protein J2X46_001565 [Nocardioides sp. BE266]|uniref:hypothetical protein n=1 Tax=Nocardioides sp. BE266 TaxID=2817725 RepID=UPI002861CB6F|nr:hypothetical protein [Nocardioides sp. BE266]MDR7252589.1 hypothetical protein [Nocardioides sp. BE266]